MSQMPEKEVIALIKAYRRRMLANGQPVKTVFALVALAGSGFPPDTCIAWGCLRYYVEMRQQQQPHPGMWEIIEIHPDQEIGA
jgi:hypothetical protein